MKQLEIAIVLVTSMMVACAAGGRPTQGNPGSPGDAGGGAPDASGIGPSDANVAVDAPTIIAIDALVDAPPVTDPFDPASCASPPITQAQLVAKFGAGASTTTLGTYTFSAEQRYCNAQTGCTAWSVISAVQLDSPPYTIAMGSTGTLVAGAGSWFTFGFDFDAGPNFGTYGDGCNVAKPIDVSPNISGCGTWELRPTGASDWMAPQWSGILANDCARLSASTTAGGNEYQWVILAQF